MTTQPPCLSTSSPAITLHHTSSHFITLHHSCAPPFTGHSLYWLGLRSRAWPTFRPLDVTLPSTTAAAPSGYSHWGSYLAASINRSVSEPNGGQVPQQLCAAANFSQSYGPPANAGPPAFEVNGSAAGWSDALCSTRLPFMCRLLGRPRLG